MKIFAVIFAGVFLIFAASSVAVGTKDWLSSGYVVTGYHSPAATWGPTVFHYGYYDYSISDPWYRYVARPYLSGWYWSSWYYPGVISVYPVSYYSPVYYWPAYYWYGSPWTYSIYYSN